MQRSMEAGQRTAVSAPGGQLGHRSIHAGAGHARVQPLRQLQRRHLPPGIARSGGCVSKQHPRQLTLAGNPLAVRCHSPCPCPAIGRVKRPTCQPKKFHERRLTRSGTHASYAAPVPAAWHALREKSCRHRRQSIWTMCISYCHPDSCSPASSLAMAPRQRRPLPWLTCLCRQGLSRACTSCRKEKALCRSAESCPRTASQQP